MKLWSSLTSSSNIAVKGYIKANFDQRDDFLDAGARFDRKAGHWYIPEDADLTAFEDFTSGFVLSDGKNHTLSSKLPDLDAASLKNRLGAFAAESRPETQGKQGYQMTPLRPLRGKKERGLWD
ncbi:MAG: hypothetical protein HRT36_02435 [Alphaproteobacteria bacterium]|nr:hypothetical protein [Alphaproteobacteria bacterium]